MVLQIEAHENDFKRFGLVTNVLLGTASLLTFPSGRFGEPRFQTLTFSSLVDGKRENEERRWDWCCILTVYLYRVYGMTEQ